MNKGLPLPGIRWRGFTLQLFLFTVLPLTILLLVIAFASQSIHHQSMRSLVGDRDLRSVRAAANGVSQEIHHLQTSLQLFAAELRNTRNTAYMLDANSVPGFDAGLALLDRSGKVISGGINGFDTIPPETTETNELSFSDPYRRADGSWVILVSAPVSENERLVGGFTASSLVRASLTGIFTPQTTVALVARHQGQPIALYLSGQSSEPMDLANQPGILEVLNGESGVNYTDGMASGSGSMLTSEHSGEHVVAFSPIAPLNWGLVIEEPWEASAGPLLFTTQSAPLILAPLLILAVVALWFGARQIIRPLQILENRASQLAGGDFQSIQQPVGGISEISQLQNTLIEMARELQAAQSALHGYIGALTAGVETERRSLARELHDDTLQSLIALNQRTQMAMLQTQDPQMRQSLLELQSQISDTIANLRRAIGGLRPIYLEDVGLNAALGMLAKQIEAAQPSVKGASGFKIIYQLRGEERRLPSEIELALYRIAQEALNNAANHAQPSVIKLTLANEVDQVCLSIVDNGRGFDVPTDANAFARQGHYGLLGMRERAEISGARYKINSQPGQGTTVEVVFSA